MNRRQFVVRAASGLALVACGGAPRLARRDRAYVCVDDVFGPLSTVPSDLATLGESYLAEHRDENDGELLVEAVLGGEGDLTEALRVTITAEHAEGSVVEVEGWRLARTEARLAALVYLSGLC